MKNLLIVILTLFVFQAGGQTLFRSGIFLHHSTGGCIWGPNGSITSVPQEMDGYNFNHGYSGSQAVTMNEEWWAPGDNEWVTQHAFFEDPDPVTGIGYYLPDNKIIVIKSCFPSSAMTGIGNSSDTLTPDVKSIYNYKWHWRHILRAIQTHPQNFFVIWTNAPLESNSTNTQEAALSKEFCIWAKDTLAEGLDPEFGPFPANAYVFDFFSMLTGANGMMLAQYAAGPGDSHPNAAATGLVAPQFVQEIFDAAIAYESVMGLQDSGSQTAGFISASPNPFASDVNVRFLVSGIHQAELSLLDAGGKRMNALWKGNEKGDHTIVVPGDALAPGRYFLMLTDGDEMRSISLIHR